MAFRCEFPQVKTENITIIIFIFESSLKFNYFDHKMYRMEKKTRMQTANIHHFILFWFDYTLSFFNPQISRAISHTVRIQLTNISYLWNTTVDVLPALSKINSNWKSFSSNIRKPRMVHEVFYSFHTCWNFDHSNWYIWKMLSPFLVLTLAYTMLQSMLITACTNECVLTVYSNKKKNADTQRHLVRSAFSIVAFYTYTYAKYTNKLLRKHTHTAYAYMERDVDFYFLRKKNLCRKSHSVHFYVFNIQIGTSCKLSYEPYEDK